MGLHGMRVTEVEGKALLSPTPTELSNSESVLTGCRKEVILGFLENLANVICVTYIFLSVLLVAM